MKSRISTLLSFLAIGVILIVSTNASFAIPASVVFGTKHPGACYNAGICTAYSDPASAPPEAINVDFSVDPKNQGTLVLTFSMNDLIQFQPDKVKDFMDPSQQYQFESAYDLTDPMFADLNLLPNASVQPVSPTSISINGDIITLTIQYAYGK